MVIYMLESAGPAVMAGAAATLSTVFPDAKFVPGAEPGKLAVWARPADHAEIGKAIEEMDKKRAAGKGALRGGLQHRDDQSVRRFRSCRHLDPDVPRRADRGRKRAGQGACLGAARGSEGDPGRGGTNGEKGPVGTARTSVVYNLESASPSAVRAAVSLLTDVYPTAKFAVGSEPGKLVAHARPAEHKEIKKTIDEMLKKEPPETARRMESYQLETVSSAAALPLLREAFPDVEFAVGTDPSKLVAWARPKEHEAIRTAVVQLGKKGPPESEPKAAVYDVEEIGAAAAIEVLTTAFPDAKLSPGSDPQKLVVLARPSDQQIIKGMLEGTKERQSRLQIHRITSADPSSIFTVLQQLFRLHPDVQLSLDEKRDAIVAVASPSQQEIIRNLIAQVEKGVAADSVAKLRTYPLEEADSAAVLKVLGTLLEKQGPKVQLSVEPRSNQLVAVAREEQHALIESTLKQLQGEKRKVEILQLESVEPSTAEMAINRLFTGGSYDGSESMPTVDVDEATQQLFLRGTEKQLAEIRDLLGKMGETHLQPSADDGRRTRVIRFDGDVSGALEEIQRVWPQLRQNPIHVMKPATEVPVHGWPIERNGPRKEGTRATTKRPPGEPGPVGPAGRPDPRGKLPPRQQIARPKSKPPSRIRSRGRARGKGAKGRRARRSWWYPATTR